MSTTPRVSIITPMYRSAATIAETVASVRAQSVGDWEQLLADDGSDDDTISVAQRAAQGDPRVRVLTLSRVGLPSVPRNAALARARSEWIAFLDADDQWEPEKLARQLALLERTGARWAFSNVRFFGSRGGAAPIGLYYPKRWRPARPFFPQCFLDGSVPCLSFIVHRDALVTVSPGGEIANAFNEDKNLKAVEDWDLVLRLAMRWEPAYDPLPLARYRVHGGISHDGAAAFARSEALLRCWRRRAIPPELITSARAVRRSKRGTARLFAGEDGWRGDFRAALRRRPLTMRDVFFGWLSLLPAPAAKAAYEKAAAIMGGQ